MTREERELSITYLEEIQESYIEGEGYERYPLPEWYALDEAIKALEQEPCCNCIEFKRYAKEMGFEIEREPKSEWQKDHEILKAYSDGANGVLDELRAEIAEEKEHAYADFERYKVECLGQDWEDALDSLPQDDFRYGMERCIDIIDKYKAESEVRNDTD